MKVFITGGTGFLGQELIRQLLEAKVSVRALVRDRHARLPLGAEAVESSLDDKPRGLPLEEAIAGVDAVFHLAGKVSRDPAEGPELHRIHVDGTKRLLKAMEATKTKRLFLSSTSGIIGCDKRGGQLATEADNATLEVIGRWPYYVSKRFQEQEVLRWHAAKKIEAVVLNPSLILGPGDDRLSSTEDVHRILSGRMTAITEGTVAMVDVRDAARGFVLAMEKGRPGERYLLNGANLSVRTFIERVCRAGDVPMPALKLKERWAVLGAKLVEGAFYAMDRSSPVDVISVEMGCAHWGCSSEKAKAELGFIARDPLETIADTVRDLEKRGLFRRRR
ncbi:MAG: NAD-dependent epimerase/dehydratase family protein [Myxococcota bacterium]